ncbi:MAG TPA: hypothetical protein VEA99_07820, partial [Gemmatimonadaceae bacterium]|nr:hypothetical protein [Gemmatimonadaceae bacterium]
AAVTSASVLFGLVGAWIGSYWGAHRGARRAAKQALANPAPQVVHVAELTRAVDAMALEVERISEAQRFLVKLLSEREAAQLPMAPPAPPPRTSGSITPH